MLLSEILKLANLINNPVNEAYKSSELQKLLDMFSRSSIMLTSEYNKTERLRYLFDGLDFDMIINFYKELIQSGNATQEDFDDPDVRESHFDIKYKKAFSNSIERRQLSPVRILTKQLQDHGCNVDISQLTDLDIEYVNVGSLEAGINAGMYDLMCYGMTYREEALDRMIFTKPIYEGPVYVMINKVHSESSHATFH